MLHFQWHGDVSTSAPPLILLHGLGSSSGDWSLQLPAFTPAHRVLVVDLPGHGRSALPRGRLTIDGMANDVAVLLERLDVPPAHVVGLSLGGCVGLALALRAPERVRSLVLVNAFARLRPVGARGAVRMLKRVVLLVTAPMPLVAAHVARGLFPDPMQRELYDGAVVSLSRMSRRAYAAACGALASFDTRTRLGSVRCPTLVVAGGRDTTVPLAAKEALARAIPGARLVTLDASGHATNVDQPERFNRTVLEFVGAVDRGSIAV